MKLPKLPKCGVCVKIAKGTGLVLIVLAAVAVGYWKLRHVTWFSSSGSLTPDHFDQLEATIINSLTSDSSDAVRSKILLLDEYRRKHKKPDEDLLR